MLTSRSIIVVAVDEESCRVAAWQAHKGGSSVVTRVDGVTRYRPYDTGWASYNGG